MKKIKFDCYRVSEKGREYEILKFPFIKYMWAFDDYPEENCLMVDGCKEAFTWMRYAFAVLSDYPDKIIYFPCKQKGIGGFYNRNYHLVLLRPELQLKRHLWTRIRKKLDKKHYAGKFVLNYDRRKLDDYYQKGLWTKYAKENSPKQKRKSLSLAELLHRGYQRQIQEIRGDTIFLVSERAVWYEWHYETGRDLDRYQSGKDRYIWSSIGWIVSDGNIWSMCREAEKEQRKKQAQDAEIRNAWMEGKEDGK